MAGCSEPGVRTLSYPISIVVSPLELPREDSPPPSPPPDEGRRRRQQHGRRSPAGSPVPAVPGGSSSSAPGGRLPVHERLGPLGRPAAQAGRPTSSVPARHNSPDASHDRTSAQAHAIDGPASAPPEATGRGAPEATTQGCMASAMEFEESGLPREEAKSCALSPDACQGTANLVNCTEELRTVDFPTVGFFPILVSILSFF